MCGQPTAGRSAPGCPPLQLHGRSSGHLGRQVKRQYCLPQALLPQLLSALPQVLQEPGKWRGSRG